MMQIFSKKKGIPRALPALSALYGVSVMFLPLTVQFICAVTAQEEKHSPGHKSAALQTAQTTLGFPERAHFSTPLGTAPPFVSFSHRLLPKNNFGNIIVPSSKAVLFSPP